jgi:dynein heavy chain
LNYENPDNFFISELISANLLQFLEDILDVTESADKQLKIESQLNEINQIWDVAEF